MNVAIVKYNAGNIYSVINALRRMGIEPLLTDDAETLRRADRVLFPGQGHAAEAMEYLKARRLDEVIRDLKQPVFGICVGQQLLCKHSEEGNADCIGIFDAESFENKLDLIFVTGFNANCYFLCIAVYHICSFAVDRKILTAINRKVCRIGNIR